MKAETTSRRIKYYYTSFIIFTGCRFTHSSNHFLANMITLHFVTKQIMLAIILDNDVTTYEIFMDGRSMHVSYFERNILYTDLKHSLLNSAIFLVVLTILYTLWRPCFAEKCFCGVLLR